MRLHEFPTDTLIEMLKLVDAKTLAATASACSALRLCADPLKRSQFTKERYGIPRWLTDTQRCPDCSTSAKCQWHDVQVTCATCRKSFIVATPCPYIGDELPVSYIHTHGEKVTLYWKVPFTPSMNDAYTIYRYSGSRCKRSEQKQVRTLSYDGNIVHFNVSRDGLYAIKVSRHIGGSRVWEHDTEYQFTKWSHRSQMVRVSTTFGDGRKDE